MKHLRTVFALLLAAALLCAAGIPAFAAPADLKDVSDEAVLYVAPGGSDSAAGTAAAPLATPAGALATAKKHGAPVTVEFAAGDYLLDAPLEFDAALSGVRLQAAKGAAVRFTGAAEISDFGEETVNGVKVFTRTFSKSDPAAGIRSLFSANGRLPSPRYPEEGFLQVKALCPEEDLLTEETTFWDFCLGQVSFYADKNEIDGAVFANGDPTVRILHYWHDEMMTAAYEERTGKVSLSRPSTMKIREGDRYYFENVFSALNAPGEWYMDGAARKLYYVPREGERADTLTLYAPLTRQLVRMDGAEHVRFENIVFSYTDWEPAVAEGESGYARYGMDSSQAAADTDGALRIENARDVVFSGCEFTHLGAWAVKFYANVHDCRVENCLFEDLAAGGVFVGGANAAQAQDGHTDGVAVENNVIHDYGRVFQNAVGLQITYASDCAFRHNEISDGFYTAISVGWDWGYSSEATHHNAIADNLIYRIGQGQLSDMGGIYLLGKQPGTVVSGNVIHDVSCDPESNGYGGWGIYLDEGSSDMVVENNLVFCCASQGLNMHYGEGNVFRNNISAFNAQGAVSAGSRDEPHATAFYYNNIYLTRDGAPVYIYMRDTGHFYENGNLMWDAARGGKLQFCRGSEETDAYSFFLAEKTGYLHNDVVADPGFVDAEHFDFTLREDSPAFDLHFRAWDYQNAGTLPGTTVGRALSGGATPYNANAVLPTFRAAKTLTGMLILAAAALLLGIVLLAVLLAGGKKAGLPAPVRLLPLLCVPAAVPTVYYFIHWDVGVYAACLVLFYLFATLPPSIAHGKAKDKLWKKLLAVILPFAAAAALHTAVILVLNNLIRIGEARAICVTFCVTIPALLVYVGVRWREMIKDKR